MMEKFESLTKFSQAQSDYIKRLEEEIDNLIETNKSIERSSSPSAPSTMASRVALFANSGPKPDSPIPPLASGPALHKPVGGPQLSIDFTEYTPTVIHHSLPDLRSQLQSLLIRLLRYQIYQN